MADKVYKGDVGTRIKLDTGQNLSAATTLRIVYEKPNGERGYWTASAIETTKLYYDTQAGNLDVDGDWTIQAFVSLPTWTGYGESVTMTVYDNHYNIPYPVLP